MPGNPPPSQETPPCFRRPILEISRIWPRLAASGLRGGGGLRSTRFEGFPACTQSQNPKIFLPAALLEPFRVYLRGKARRRRKIFTIWGAEIEIYKGESPPQARKNRDFGPSKRRFSKGNWSKNVKNLPKIEDSHDAHRKPPPCFVRIFEPRGGGSWHDIS